MGAPLFLYENFLETATLSASTTESGFDVNNLTNRLPDVGSWKNVPGSEPIANASSLRFDLGSAKSPNTLAITTHNMGTLTTGFQINYSDAPVIFGSPYTVGLAQAGLIDNDGTFLWNFGTSLGSHRYWEFAFDSLPASPALYIGAAVLGRKWEFPEYMTRGFDPDALTLKYRQSRARGGNFVGGIVDHVDQRVELKFGPAGLSRSAFHDVSATTPQSWLHFHQTCWSNGLPWWAKWAGDQYDTSTARPGWYCFPDANDKSSAAFISSTRRAWKFGFKVKAENFGRAA